MRVALIHAQFETIHPFLDGNGRIGRLLIAALLEHWHLLPEPLLYLSAYLKQYQTEYYRRLSGIRAEGDWEGWVAFFLEGVANVASEAERARQILDTSFPTTSAAVNQLVDLGIVKEMTGQKKNRIYSYQGYVDLLTR